MRVVVIAAGFAAALTGCSVGNGSKVAAAPEPRDAITEAAAPGPVIVTLQSQSGRVTVYASETGPLFTIADNDGNVEAEALSYVELQDLYPEYYRALRSSIAADGRMYAGYDAVTNGEVGERTIEDGASPQEEVEIPTLDASAR